MVARGCRLRRLRVPLDAVQPAGRAWALDRGGARLHARSRRRAHASSPTFRRSAFRPGHGSLPPRSKEREPDRRPKIVDRFLVRRTSAVAAGPAWNALQAELQALARLLREGQHDEVHHRLIGRVAAALRRQRGEEPGLEPLDLTIDPGADPAATVVHIAAGDSFGFLSLTVSALALCGIMIVQADIRTGDGRVNDTLWVTDRSGHKITAESQLRELRLSLDLDRALQPPPASCDQP